MFCDSIVWCYSQYRPSPLRDRIMFFSSCSLYGVSLWSNKVLTGSIPLCLERPDSDNGIYFCYQVHVCLISFFFSLDYVCEHKRHKLCFRFSNLFICVIMNASI